mmetsp:Transcript_5386/g.12783  ORF Transcript_5386/g.12783 Transcript_5386/m.12783 type:complete len:453 (-) Transcript_5386:832-2190(-)
MEKNIYLDDPVFDDMPMPNKEERQTFLCVCRRSFDIIRHKNTGYSDWKVFVSLLLQMGLVDLARTEAFYDYLERKVNSNGCSDGSWCFNTCKDGRIDRLRLEPGSIDAKIPAIIRRLDGLKVLNLTGQNVNSLHLEEISLIPHLQELKMVWNKETLVTIADKVRSNDLSGVSKSLRKVHFLRHENWETNELDLDLKNPDTKAALRTFLDFFVTVDTVQFPDDSSETNFSFEDDWKYSLIKNNVGRRIFEGGQAYDNGDWRNNAPLSIWPKILERAQKVTDERANATGIYYLLREGPVLRNHDPSFSKAALADFTQESINSVENYLAHKCNGRRLPKIDTTSPFEKNINPSGLELKQELSPSQTSYYQSQTIILRRIYELGRADIYSVLLELENHLQSPRSEHLEAMFRVYSYLNIERILPSVDDESLSGDPSHDEKDWIYIPKTERYVDDTA